MRTPWWFLPALALLGIGGAATRELVVWPRVLADHDWATAERIARDRLEARRTWLGEDAWWTGRGWYTLAWVIEETDPRGAVALADEARQIFERAAGPDHPRVATAFELRGVAHAHAGELDAAKADQLEALRIREAALGPWDEAVARSCANLAIVEDLRGQRAEALRWNRRSREIRRVLGSDPRP